MKAIMTDQVPTLELMRKARRGERRAFDAIVERYQNRLDSFIRSRVRPQLRKRLTIEELVNETFARAFQSLDRFNGDSEDSFVGWLAGISKNVVLMELDRLHRDQALQIDRDLSGGDPSPSQVARRHERFDRLKEAIEGLSGDYRQVILLCRIEGLPIKTVAERMNRSPAAVKKLLWRALNELKSTFGDTESLHLPDGPLELDGDQKRG